MSAGFTMGSYGVAIGPVTSPVKDYEFAMTMPGYDQEFRTQMTPEEQEIVRRVMVRAIQDGAQPRSGTQAAQVLRGA